jgi:hypothetical protein
MNLFELSTLLSPLGGAIGVALAVDCTVPSATGWLWLGIPIGLVFGLGFYYCLLRLVVGKHDEISNLPGWRLAAMLGVPVVTPHLTAALMFILMKTILDVAA